MWAGRCSPKQAQDGGENSHQAVRVLHSRTHRVAVFSFRILQHRLHSYLVDNGAKNGIYQ